MSAATDPARPFVLIPQRFGSLMALVARGRKSNQAVFPNAFDLVCFSAAVGYAKRRTGAISKNSSDKTDGGEVVMTDPERQDRALCDMIAVAHARSDEILSPGRLQERLDVFMQYACGGMEYLLELIASRPARAAVEVIIRGTDQDSSIQELDALGSLGDHP